MAAAGIAVALVLGGSVGQVGGFFKSGSAIPNRRLFFDLGQGGVINAYPTPDGRRLLRYNRERRGFELSGAETGRTTTLTPTSGVQPLLVENPGRDLNFSPAPDGKRIVAVREFATDSNQSARAEPVGRRCAHTTARRSTSSEASSALLSTCRLCVAR